MRYISIPTDAYFLLYIIIRCRICGSVFYFITSTEGNDAIIFTHLKSYRNCISFFLFSITHLYRALLTVNTWQSVKKLIIKLESIQIINISFWSMCKILFFFYSYISSCWTFQLIDFFLYTYILRTASYFS